MLIKEFRIIIPMSVDEYQIGQLYTIQKKSRLETTGAGSGVEILKNEPYEAKNEKGQYTLKVYHVDERLPAALKTMSKLLFPKSALMFEEESWNCYPYTRTKYKHRLFKSFNIDIESKYLPDYGQSDNVFNLSSSELSMRQIDYIDIVNDQINPNEYKREEDPLFFESKKTNRGPLATNWIEELKANAIPNPKSSKTIPKSSLNNKPVEYMCAYKLCRIECAFWGCQSRVEKLISESVLRNMIFVSHRQAWCWQDEYQDMSIDDVRELERETQNYLYKKMRNENTPSDNANENKSPKQSRAIIEEFSTPTVMVNIDKRKESLKIINTIDHDNQQRKISKDNEFDDVYISKLEMTTHENKTVEFTEDDNGYDEDDEDGSGESACDKKSLNSDEFYDAVSQISFNLSTQTNEMDSKSTNSISLPVQEKRASIKNTKNKVHYKFRSRFQDDSTSGSGGLMSNSNTITNIANVTTTPSFKNSNYEQSNEKENDIKKGKIALNSSIKSNTTFNSIFSSTSSSTSSLSNQPIQSKLPLTNQNDCKDISSVKVSKVDTLLLVIHGGNVTCTDTSKKSDFLNFKTTIESVIKANYSNLCDRIEYRLVSCDSICKEALVKLACLSPVVNQHPFSPSDSDEFAETSATFFSVHESLPFNTLPLLALANSSRYRIHLAKLIRECNKVYADFLNSPQGNLFNGQVIIVSDSLGSILFFDSLTLSNYSYQNADELSRASSTSSSQFNMGKEHQSTINSNDNHSSRYMHVPGADADKTRTQSVSPSNLRKNYQSNLATTMTNLSIGCTGPGTPTSTVVTATNPKININDDSWLQNDDAFKPLNRNLSDFDLTASTGYLTASPFQSMLLPSVSTEERFDFKVAHFFIFGSPLGLILAYRKMANENFESTIESQIYNLFHLTDPIAVRIEPLLCKQFKNIEPCMVPRYSKFPLGDGSNSSLDHYIIKHGNLFDTKNLISNNENHNNSSNNLKKHPNENINDYSNSLLTPNFDQLKSLQKILHTKSLWWGDNRIDYVLYAPEKISNLPRISLPYIFHSCYWESTDVASFILRMIFKNDLNYLYGINSVDKIDSIENTKEPEKWQKRMNRVKLRNLSANHRANDVIVLEDKEQILTAKFSYGPLDFALSGEKVDIYITTKPSSSTSSDSEWKYYSSSLTDSHGKIEYVLPKEKRLALGIYKIKMIVKCDQTYCEFHMAVLPTNTETVVFSIDGSFAANISFTGTDPKVRAGAVDVVRYWQDLGYLIIYITARPDIQHYKVTNWLAQHNFPFGMVYFSEGIYHDPIRQKTKNLRNIVINNNLKLQAGYGSAKDIMMYSSLGVPSNKIFIMGKTKAKYVNKAIYLRDGYASHLSYLQNPNTGHRQASGNARLILKKVSFNIKQHSVMSTGSNNSENNNPVSPNVHNPSSSNISNV